MQLSYGNARNGGKTLGNRVGRFKLSKWTRPWRAAGTTAGQAYLGLTYFRIS